MEKEKTELKVVAVAVACCLWLRGRRGGVHYDLMWVWANGVRVAMRGARSGRVSMGWHRASRWVGGGGRGVSP
eukprot:scaffold129611_cov33-Tisochrysis_lutea.AAC.4